ncbi:hypothetical protein [Pseudonocardia sp. GCM10023141]|uniref:hypothetical protein n=1 Tax=Pseudonocardia sp. GCM10023141 TaxID=3252653 RepID=UPI00361448B3
MTERSNDTVGTDDSLEVLRAIWTAKRQTRADIEQASPKAKVCKNMKNIGFGGLGGDGSGDADTTAVPVGEELRAAWRERLAQDGKLHNGAGSVFDLVNGDA